MKPSIEQEAGSTAKPTHPAWLQREINKAQDRKQQAEHYAQQQEHKHQRVTEQAAKTRQRIRTTQPAQPPHPPHQPTAVAFINDQRPATSTPHTRPHPARTTRPKPAWALTAAEDERALDAECEALVGFVEGLDFDVWMDGVERRVEEEKEDGMEKSEQEMGEASRDGTLGEVTVEVPADEWDEQLPRPPTGIRPATQSTQQRLHTANSRPHTARPATSPQAAPAAAPADHTQTLVATLLHSSPAIRNIHSSHSLRALIASAQSGAGQQCGHVAMTANSVSVAIEAPLVSVVATRETVFGKINPSQLPYLHRHPAV